MATLSNSYTPNVPQGNQQFNQTQPLIESNFQAIAELIGVNHIPFNTANDFGKHDVVTYFGQSVIPPTVASSVSLYSAPVANDTNGYELFYKYQTGNIAQLTNNSSSTSSSSSSVGNGGIFQDSTAGGTYFGYQYLPGGLLMKFGNVFTSTLQSQSNPAIPSAFSFPVLSGVPVFTSTPFYITASPQAGYVTPSYQSGFTNFFISIAANSSTQFTITSVSASFASAVPYYANQYVYWLAIGV